MALRYPRLGSILAIFVVFLIILASLNRLQYSESTANLPTEAKQPERQHQDAEQVEAPPPESNTEPDPEGVFGEKPPERRPFVLDPDKAIQVGASSSKEKNETASPTNSTEDPTSTLSKIIVMGKLSHEETDWVGEEMTDWQNAIYYVDLPAGQESPSGLKTKMNKAKEATPYLTYIVDHYPDFPDIMAFIHAHRRGMPAAWHNDAPNYDAVNMLNALRLNTVQERGYVNLRCNPEVGCPEEILPFRNPPIADKFAEHAYPYVYATFFNASWQEMEKRIPVVATQCCAQFAVSKEQMLKKPKHEYERYKSWIEETHLDDATAGRVLEYMWHIIFDREPVHCENVFQCWCEVYGRCHSFGLGGSDSEWG